MANRANGWNHFFEKLTPFRIALIYVVIGSLWIVFSDHLLTVLINNPTALTTAQTLKGWFYVAATGGLLYWLIKQSQAALWQSKEAVRHREAELRATSAQLETALQTLIFHVENSPLAVIEWDSQFRIQRWSQRAVEIFGWQATEVLGKNPAEVGFTFTEDREAVDQVIDRLMNGSHPRSVNRNRNYTKDGAVIYCEWYESALFNESGQLVSVLSLVHNVTVQEQARQALYESEERFRATFEQAAVGLAHVGLDGHWLRVNQKLCDIVGYSPEALLELTFQAITYPDDLEADLAQTQRLLTGEIKTYSMEKRYIRQDSLIVWINLTGSLVRESSGEPKYFIAVVEDISARKDLEEQLRQSQKMEAIGRLAGGVAHDFNNLLTIINGYSDLSLNGLSEDHPLYLNLKAIRRAGDRAAGLTRQLLAFSRRQILQLGIFNLNELVLDMSNMLRRLIGEDIDLVVLPGENLGKVKVDPNQIEGVIMNLAINARDAMPHGGALTIELANVELDEAYTRQHVGLEPGSYIRLAINDTGLGMDKETQSRIFEPFFTTKEQGKGIGLGLATVYGIVSQSGGYVRVYSEPGWGTTFKIYLPQVKEAVESLSSPEVLPTRLASPASETILLVEDESGVRDFVRDTLVEAGYKVLEAGNSAEALRRYEQHPDSIHLLLTDVILPGQNGRELAETLLALQPELKVLYMSGYTANVIVHRGILEAGIDFLPKPFTPQALVSKVRQVLDMGLT
jgi:two-component system, cell cycle sensor histidine kinase and response regulator CckA